MLETKNDIGHVSGYFVTIRQYLFSSEICITPIVIFDELSDDACFEKSIPIT